MLKRRTRHLTHPLGKGHRDFSHFKRCKNTAILIAISTDNNSPIICSLLALLIHRGFIFLSTIVPGTIGIQDLNCHAETNSKGSNRKPQTAASLACFALIKILL